MHDHENIGTSDHVSSIRHSDTQLLNEIQVNSVLLLVRTCEILIVAF